MYESKEDENVKSFQRDNDDGQRTKFHWKSSLKSLFKKKHLHPQFRWIFTSRDKIAGEINLNAQTKTNKLI